jgi:predicted negative regulator of RcsB-dependent stress response
VDRLTRKELKSDPLANEFQHSVEFVAGHKQQLIRYGGAAVVVAVLAAAFYFYHQHEVGARQAALSQAIQISQATVGAASQSSDLPNFATQAAKDAAQSKAFADVAARYSGTDEGTVAEFYLASMAADNGKLDEAEKRYRNIADNGSGAKLSLAKIYSSQGKTADAEKLVRSVIDKPTILVSKESATIALARIIAPQNKKQALSLLGPLRASDRPAVSKTAIDAIADLKLE